MYENLEHSRVKKIPLLPHKPDSVIRKYFSRSAYSRHPAPRRLATARVYHLPALLQAKKKYQYECIESSRCTFPLQCCRVVFVSVAPFLCPVFLAFQKLLAPCLSMLSGLSSPQAEHFRFRRVRMSIGVLLHISIISPDCILVKYCYSIKHLFCIFSHENTLITPSFGKLNYLRMMRHAYESQMMTMSWYRMNKWK